MRFSIIIPVWNNEKWLSKCFDSILNQTFKDYEIIKGKMDSVFLTVTGKELEGGAQL